MPTPVRTVHVEGDGLAAWRAACQSAYATLRDLREDPHDEITPVEYFTGGEHRTYLHASSGRTHFVAIVEG
jgi:hypothetical protein